ncbi:MAG TPA: hypothetical protein VME23_16510 [Terracidiphilus sp.]|nr:hypothetical protein [Terracidiphilus sp.]
MNLFSRYGNLSILGLATALFASGCHGKHNQTQNPVNDSVTQAQADQGTDPASANLAPATYTTTGASDQAGATAGPSDQSGASSAANDASNSTAGEETDQSANFEQPAATAPQPPPPLPVYNQPPCPGDGYIWTPGYWSWAPTGYYWVPGVWVAPPYVGALWTPGYWGFSLGQYAFFPGHWGLHIGFYGGINYGFGYIGVGYEGGYWNNGHFAYNSVYNNVGVNVVHNVYRYNVINRNINQTRVSFNGGRGGVYARPGPAEMAARREPYAPRMAAQVQHAESFRANREQFDEVNHGRPANLAVSRPIEADRNVRPVAAPRPFVGHAVPSRPEGRPAGGGRPEHRP